MSLLTAHERRLLQGIKDAGTAGSISDEWIVAKGWGTRSGKAIKLTSLGASMLSMHDNGMSPTTSPPHMDLSELRGS
jgi:hypothetical protein